MPAEILRLGPFSGGLNIGSDPTQVGDNELIECLNLELDIDGALISRPAIQIIEEGAQNQRLLIFGSVVFSSTLYLFATRDGSTFISSDEGASWTELNPGAASRECKTMEVYNNTVWMPATPSSANGGISWTPGGGAVAVAAMPRGNKCVVHKNRLYICPGEDETSNESRLHFSDAADFTAWSNFIDVQPGDGDTLNNVAVYQDNLLLFKGESTHVLAYDLDPVDAILREINPVVGSTGSFGVVQYENTVYCMHGNKVYEINNYNFGLLNLKVPFVFDNALPTGTTARYEDQHLSILGDRLIVRFFNRTYALNLRTNPRTWGEWQKTDDSSTIEWHIFGPLVRARDTTGSGKDAYYSGYSFDVSSGGYKVIKIIDGRTAGAAEGTGTHIFYCIATTKNYDMADPVRYKRLFWWGADLISGEDVLGSILPITLVNSVSWDALTTETWADLETWGNPTMGSVAFQETITGDNITNTNRVIKFGKSLRFRKANFSLRIQTDGTPEQPAKIFNYIAVVGLKQLVSARAS